MALTLALDITTLNCNYVEIYDNTGLYNVTTNPGGWSDLEVAPYPTLRRQDITSATITIKNHITGVEITDSPWDITAVLTGVPGATYPLIFLQQQLVMVDGIYEIILTVSDGTQVGTFTTTYKKYFYCTVVCCVMTGWIAMEANLCNPCDTSYLTIMRMKQNLYDTLKAAECKQDDCAFNNALLRLQRLCEGLDSYSVSPCNCN
jgi:hypothetical protein